MIKATPKDPLAELKAVNRDLQRQLAQIAAENLSQQNEIAGLKKQLRENGVSSLGDALRQLRQRVYGVS